MLFKGFKGMKGMVRKFKGRLLKYVGVGLLTVI